MRFALLLIVATVSITGHAQFGIGMAPGMQCPYPNQPGQGAINGNDEIRNLQGELYSTRQLLEHKKQKLGRLNTRIAKGKSGMGKVLGASAIQAIDEHARYTRNSTDYQDECSAPDRTASAGGEAVDAVYLPDEGGAVVGDGLTPVPTVYCHNGTLNVWSRVVADGGRMQDRVCDFHIPAKRAPPSDAARVACADGLAAYYESMDEKIQLETEIAELDAQMMGYERRLEQIQDQITEGTYCPHCGSEDGNMNNGGTFNWLQAGVAVLGILGNVYQQKQQRKQQQEVLDYYARLGYPPHMIPRRPQGAPMGGPMQPPMFPGPSAFPGNPYAASTPGYMGTHNGVYGAMPGAMGPGAFGCQGTSPYGMQNPMANPFDPFMNSQANPFANPYMNNQMMNPGMNNGMFNPGYGPGIMPYNGNPMFNPYNPYGNTLGYNAPGMLPGMNGMNGMQNPYFQNPYAYNPYAPYGSPYYNGGQAPGILPYNGAQNPWSNNPYAPGILPYQNGYGNPSMVNYPGMQGNNPWSAPYMASPVQNFYTQIEQLKRQINVIQGGGYYGGGTPPAILPMPTPVYNTPGSSLNPTPTTPPVQPPPTTPPSPGTQPIQIR